MTALCFFCADTTTSIEWVKDKKGILKPILNEHVASDSEDSDTGQTDSEDDDGSDDEDDDINDKGNGSSDDDDPQP